MENSSRPNLMYPTSLLSIHLAVAKRILRYLKGSADYGVWYLKGKEVRLEGFVDSDKASCLDDSKSASSFVFYVGSDHISWNSKMQDVVAQSTTEAKYVSIAATANQSI
ncbi:hypothetical protein GH714_039684 [Hevea brasiliensis]|uniref:Reverse transcriptase Ty1/copia-type domain-containing protein n=1 Tax=Hevea brasiliensis TaxID=3981 RepID=A0A6A6MZ75_HEVBR|nr:hypothetical protein GH714_039684 [Hevea brasiliensis]